MITCPSCNEKTPIESLFCDQCGIELKICPKCGEYGKVNRCKECGTILQTVAQFKQTQDTIKPTKPQNNTPKDIKIKENQPQSTILELKAPAYFENKGLDINLQLFDNMVIGRNTEKHNISFANNGTISRAHCRINIINNQGSITDLGSTNGTFVNGLKLTPNVAQSIKCGDIVKIAFTELNVI